MKNSQQANVVLMPDTLLLYHNDGIDRQSLPRFS